MPDDIIISELSNAPQIDDSAVFPLTQDNGGSPATFKASMSQIAGKIGEGTTFANLQTTSKTLVGALNELKAGGGGSVDITTEIDTPSAIQTFSDGGDNIPMKSCEVAIVAQQASGTPSPTNPLPITGFSSVKVVDCSINQWDEQWELGTLGWNDGSEQPANDYIRAKNYISVKPSKTYYVVTGSKGLTVYTYGIDKSFKRRVINGSTSVLLQINADEYFIRFRTAAQTTTYANDISINYPSTDTQYHAYTGTTTPVSLGQTIYGGTAELVGGNGSKTWGEVDLSTLTYTQQTIGGVVVSVTSDITDALLPSSNQDAFEGISEQYETIRVTAVTTGKIALATNGVLYVGSNSPTGKLIYKLATPTAFTFTGATIPTLSGVNNVYADSGDVNALEYFNDKADDIAALINVYPYEVSGVLTAGQTSITLSSGLIKADSTIDVYTDGDVDYNSVSVSSGSVTITFDAQASNLGVKVRIS